MKVRSPYIEGHRLGCECVNCEHVRLLVETADHGDACECDKCKRVEKIADMMAALAPIK